MIKETKMLRIDEIIEETANVRTFIFHEQIDFQPGQFIMVWIPRLDEKPFTISSHNSKEFGVTIFKIGDFTNKFYSMKVGDQVGIRGPYGRGFALEQNACAIGGGVGMASIAPLFSKLNGLIIVQGAQTASSILYQKRFPEMIVCTDDGSSGHKGYPTDLLPELLKKEKFTKIYTCGPEIMMKKIVDFCKNNKIKCEASLERFMKCGIGVCGQCVCDGLRVCTDGPVFDSSHLNQMNDFGKSALLKSGKRVTI